MHEQMMLEKDDDLKRSNERLEEVTKECDRLNDALVTTQNERDENGIINKLINKIMN
jgi:hypothetical protein